MIRFEQVSKQFGGVRALDAVTLSIATGECHALMGENGAGKSTLGKTLAGIHRPDSGHILLDGQRQAFHSPRDAVRAGIGMVHQELAFCPDLSIAENLCLGHYPRRLGVLVDRRAMRRRADELLGRIGVRLDVRAPMASLSTAQEQLVQIAAAVGTGARVLIFDEPTSSLSEPESQRLFTLIEQLRAGGATILYVSHRLPEVLRLCDRISVLRDGRYVTTLGRDEASESRLVSLMAGGSDAAPRAAAPPTPTADAPAAAREPVLRVAGLASPGQFEPLSFTVGAGEIVGLAGLVGAGRSAVAQAIFGLDRRARGQVTLAGQPLRLGSVRAALRAGIGLVPEDRKRQGLVLPLSCRFNFALGLLDRLHPRGWLRQRAERRAAADAFARLQVKTAGLDAPVASLSGGNQQKVVLARWLARGGRLLIVDEPTRGVDVGAKAAIHDLLLGLARDGLAILLISSDLPEVLHLSDRILVLREGRLAGELPRAEATQDRVLAAMTGSAAA